MENQVTKNGGGLFGSALLGILTTLVGVACGLCGAVVVSVSNMYCLDSPSSWNYRSKWLMHRINTVGRSNFINRGTLIACGLGVVFILLLIALCVRAGRYRSNADGTIGLIWVDKIWSELQIILLVSVCAGAVACGLPIVEMVPCYPYLNFYEPFETERALYGLDNEYIAILCAAGMFLAIFCAIWLFVSLIKKLKAHMFWEHSVFGGIILWISRRYKGSSDITVKTTLALCAAALFCGTWIGIPVVIGIILWKVPQMTKRFAEIREGVDEVRSGNLEYKIPVYTDRKGVKGDLDRLALGINDISSASNLAVQNEIRNQRTKSELISNVSHDLKTPMTSIISYVDLLKKEGLDSENAPKYLNILDEKTSRLKSLTEDLFEAAKASSGDIPCEITDIDLGALVNQALGEMSEKLSARGLDVQVKNTAQNSMVKADGQLLWRVIENLLSNVSKYALENSRVYVNVSDAANDVLLEVKNMSRDALNISADELLERFKRGDEARATEGSGLGLAIAKDLTHIMNGIFEITVDGDLFKASVLLPKA